jgi:hypothetical protein
MTGGPRPPANLKALTPLANGVKDGAAPRDLSAAPEHDVVGLTMRGSGTVLTCRSLTSIQHMTDFMTAARRR